MGNGKVIGGQYVNAIVMLTPKGELALQVPMKLRKVPLNAETVAEWDEIAVETRSGTAGTVSAVGQAMAGAVLPGLVGKMASAAVGATVNAASQQRSVRIDWTDGHQSLLRLPDQLFTHLLIVLRDRQPNQPPLSPPPPPPAAIVAPPPPAGTSQEAAGLVPSPQVAEVDVMEQIAKLAKLRDLGALTEEEFATKKMELLARL